MEPKNRQIKPLALTRRLERRAFATTLAFRLKKKYILKSRLFSFLLV